MAHEEKVVEAVERILPSVVSVVITKHAEFVDRILPLKGLAQPEKDDEDIRIGGGSGFVVSNNGLVLTNKHVISDPSASYIVLDQDGKKYDAHVLAHDPIHDVAILKTDLPSTTPVAILGDSSSLKLGQTVIAIGNALGEFQSSVSTGVVSGLSRFITAVNDMSGHQERLRGLIQTDAAIKPGNSGGPLVSIAGEIIGINSAVIFGAQNIGFAIPINKAKRDLQDIKQFGRIRRPFLGIRYIILNTLLQKKFGLSIDYGALVVREQIPGDHAVVPGSAAESAGITEGDIILSCNGRSITEQATLEDTLETIAPGDTISLVVLRGTEKHPVQITLKEWRMKPAEKKSSSTQ